MNLHTLIFTNNACYKAGRKITPRGIRWHSTGANNPWLKRYVGPDDGLLERTSTTITGTSPWIGRSAFTLLSASWRMERLPLTRRFLGSPGLALRLRFQGLRQ